MAEGDIKNMLIELGTNRHIKQYTQAVLNGKEMVLIDTIYPGQVVRVLRDRYGGQIVTAKDINATWMDAEEFAKLEKEDTPRPVGRPAKPAPPVFVEEEPVIVDRMMIVTGTVTEGFKYYGPFHGDKQVRRWVREHRVRKPWHVATITGPAPPPDRRRWARK